MYLAGQKSDFYYNHIHECLSCCAWYAARKDADKFDINGVGHCSDNFEELRVFGKDYDKAFGKRETFPEDFAYGHGAAFPMNRVCSNCGQLLKSNGKCPICDEPD